MITLSQTAFQDYVPAFRDSEPRTYDAILPYMERYLREAETQLHVPENFEDTPRLEAFVYKSAAFDALPHVDLVLTESGFAVVSNQNLAPASRDRVDRLREQLRQEKSVARDALLGELVKIEKWRENFGPQLRTSLLWTPSLCRSHGITTANNSHVFDEEFDALRANIDAAQADVAKIISREQMDWLLRNQDVIDPGDMRAALCDKVRYLMAAIVMRLGAATRTLRENLQSFLNLRAEDLPEYRDSSKYAADHFQPYENKAEDSCFFFGA